MNDEALAAKERILGKREYRKFMMEQGHNHYCPVLSKAPFVTHLKVGHKVRIRFLTAGGDYPLYLSEDGWTVIGYRWSEVGMVKELIVLQKDDRVINMHHSDIYLYDPQP